MKPFLIAVTFIVTIFQYVYFYQHKNLEEEKNIALANSISELRLEVEVLSKLAVGKDCTDDGCE